MLCPLMELYLKKKKTRVRRNSMTQKNSSKFHVFWRWSLLKLSGSLISHSKDQKLKRKGHNLRPQYKHIWLPRTINCHQKSIHYFPKLVWGESPHLHRHSACWPDLQPFAGGLYSIIFPVEPIRKGSFVVWLPLRECWEVSEKMHLELSRHDL